MALSPLQGSGAAGGHIRMLPPAVTRLWAAEMDLEMHQSRLPAFNHSKASGKHVLLAPLSGSRPELPAKPLAEAPVNDHKWPMPNRQISAHLAKELASLGWLNSDGHWLPEPAPHRQGHSVPPSGANARLKGGMRQSPPPSRLSHSPAAALDVSQASASASAPRAAAAVSAESPSPSPVFSKSIVRPSAQKACGVYNAPVVPGLNLRQPQRRRKRERRDASPSKGGDESAHLAQKNRSRSAAAVTGSQSRTPSHVSPVPPASPAEVRRPRRQQRSQSEAAHPGHRHQAAHEPLKHPQKGLPRKVPAPHTAAAGPGQQREVNLPLEVTLAKYAGQGKSPSKKSSSPARPTVLEEFTGEEHELAALDDLSDSILKSCLDIAYNACSGVGAESAEKEACAIVMIDDIDDAENEQSLSSGVSEGVCNSMSLEARDAPPRDVEQFANSWVQSLSQNALEFMCADLDDDDA